MPPEKSVSVRGILPDYSAAVQDFFRKWLPMFTSHGFNRWPAARLWQYIYDEGYKEKDVDAEVSFRLAKDVPSKGEFICKGIARFTTEDGDDDSQGRTINTIGTAYTALGKWIEANGYQIIAGPVVKSTLPNRPRSGTHHPRVYHWSPIPGCQS